MPLISLTCLSSIVVSGLALNLHSRSSLVSSDSCCVSDRVSDVPLPLIDRLGAGVSRPKDIALVSWLASPWSNDGYRAMLWNRKRYAELQGYTFLEFNESTLPRDLQDKWQASGTLFKPLLMNHLLQHRGEGTWLVWNDADTIYTNWSKAWETYLGGSANIVVAEAPDIIFNNGVFALRVSNFSRAFVQDWLADYGCCGLADNGAFVHAVLRSYMRISNTSYSGICKLSKFKMTGSCYRAQLKKLIKHKHLSRAVGPYGITGCSLQGSPIKGAWGINSGIRFNFPNSWERGDFILHFAGTGTKEREHLAMACTEPCST